MNHLYLGYGNPRKAYHAGDRNVIVVYDTPTRVLQGEQAEACRLAIGQLTAHTCGVVKHSWCDRWLTKHPDTGGGRLLDAYNALLDHYL